MNGTRNPTTNRDEKPDSLLSISTSHLPPDFPGPHAHVSPMFGCTRGVSHELFFSHFDHFRSKRARAFSHLRPVPLKATGADERDFDPIPH